MRSIPNREIGKEKLCVTDPDATIATNARNRHLEPCYKQHTAVDDKAGVILDVEVTTGAKNEGEMIAPQVDEVKATTGVDIKAVGKRSSPFSPTFQQGRKFNGASDRSCDKVRCPMLWDISGQCCPPACLRLWQDMPTRLAICAMMHLPA
jgi:hypothetical protein